MVDVTTKNFEQLLPEILADIKAALFVAIDTEFTGLLADDVFKNSLFDDGIARYKKQRDNINQFMICQFGLAVYKNIPDTNKYAVTTYNFYLRPQSCTSFDPHILCQTSSIEFLKKYNFDFNKWLNVGVPYMNTDEANDLLSELQSVVKGEKDIHLSFELRDHLTAIEVWAETAQEGNTTTITAPLDSTSQLLIITAVQNLCMDIWASLKNGQVVIRKVCMVERKRLETAEGDGSELAAKLVEQLLGFTTVFRYLAKLHKPLVLHNCFLDLMLMYKQFHGHLPASYHTFKSELHQMFPIIYDTKVLANEFKYLHRNADKNVSSIIGNTSLGDLAVSLRNELPVLYRPSHTHVPQNSKYGGSEVMLHEAGYDAYLTGFCFLSLSHLYTMLQMPLRIHQRPLSPRELLYSIKVFANRVRVQYSMITYINLTGNDPATKRPPWLLVEARQGWSRLSPTLVSTALSRFGNIEIRPHNKCSALVATTSWKRTNDIYHSLSNDKLLKVQVYNSFRHSPVIRTLGWSVGLMSSGLSVWLIYKTFKKALS